MLSHEDHAIMALTHLELERALQDAVGAMQRGDVVKAHEIAEHAIDAGAEHPFLLKVEALWLHANGQYRDALRNFHHARTLTPDDPSIASGIAACLAGMAEYGPALEMVDESLRLMPGAAATYHLRGWILELAGDFPGARKSYERALSIVPTYLEASAGLAFAAAMTNDFAVARSQAMRVLTSSPQQPTARIALALSDIAQGEATTAEGQMRDLVEISGLPDRVRALAWSVLGDALEAQNRAEEALIARHERDQILSTSETSGDPS
jgi:Flp pilus assembly protein TadD